MKESELIKMQREIHALKEAVNYLLGESANIKTLASGTFEIVKLMPDYDESITKLTEKLKEQHVEQQLD